jgi:serine/threonine protein kinase
MQPWMKLVRISSLLDDLDGYDTGISSESVHSSATSGRESSDSINEEELPGGGRRAAAPGELDERGHKDRADSFEAFGLSLQDQRMIAEYDDVGYREEDDEEHLHPGTYLLPVKDPLFTVRLREYRRTRFEKLMQQPQQQQQYQQQLQHQQPLSEANLIKQQQRDQQRQYVASMFELRPYLNKTVKERYTIDVYGKCIRRGSLSRSTRSSVSSARGASASALRVSESPYLSTLSAATGAGIGTGTDLDAVSSTQSSRASSVAASMATASGSAGLELAPSTLQKSLQNFVDYRHDKRSMAGEGSAPIVREKLKDMFLLVGSVVTLRCKIEGNPAPKCFWYHNDRLIIGDDDRFKFAQAEDGVSTLSICKARVSDIGVYRCVARNRFGVSITKAKLTVGDAPDKPSRPIVAQYSSDQVYLIWESPAFNGNSDILCYKVDYKISGDVKWSNALYTIEESCLVKNLMPFTSYRFRVSCINTIGVSSYSWASEEITTLAPGESKITIDHEQAQKLLKNQYNLEKRSQQLVLIRKLDEESSEQQQSHLGKKDVEDIFKIQSNQNPNDLYTLENKLYKLGDVCLYNAKDNANQTRKLIKMSSKLNENEIRILRELREQDRLVQLIEGFQFSGNVDADAPSKKSTYALVYAHAVPVVDFVTFRHKYSEELVVKIMRQLIDAVQWIHLHGFVHLNIHPLTILNANLTHVNVKLSGFENAVQLSDLVKDGETHAESGATALSIVEQISMPIDFSGKPESLDKKNYSFKSFSSFYLFIYFYLFYILLFWYIKLPK